MYEIEEKSFHFATYLPSLLYDVLSGLICASKYERDCDKWSRPTLISLPERQGIGKLSTLRLRGRNPGKRSGNTPKTFYLLLRGERRHLSIIIATFRLKYEVDF